MNKNQITKDLNGKTITFYSYKGGVGRTMALVNIAYLMAKQQKKQGAEAELTTKQRQELMYKGKQPKLKKRFGLF